MRPARQRARLTAQVHCHPPRAVATPATTGGPATWPAEDHCWIHPTVVEIVGSLGASDGARPKMLPGMSPPTVEKSIAPANRTTGWSSVRAAKARKAPDAWPAKPSPRTRPGRQAPVQQQPCCHVADDVGGGDGRGEGRTEGTDPARRDVERREEADDRHPLRRIDPEGERAEPGAPCAQRDPGPLAPGTAPAAPDPTGSAGTRVLTATAITAVPAATSHHHRGHDDPASTRGPTSIPSAVPKGT